jgi:hypothetical protein
MGIEEDLPTSQSLSRKQKHETGLPDRSHRESTYEGKHLKEMGKALTMIQSPNPYLGIEFFMEETQNCQSGGLGTESRSWESTIKTC